MTASVAPDGRTPAQGRQWLTRFSAKRILAIVHTPPYANRLFEALSVVENDLRLQVRFTAPPHVFGGEVPGLLRRHHCPVLPWEEAVASSFDLALAAGPGGVDRIKAPLVALSHGAAYLKRITGAGAAEEGVAGLRRRDVMPDGRTLPAALVLPHEAELAELARSCPEALPVARVAGDPVYDRITASLPYRSAYRAALGLREGEKLVLFPSTWGPHSSFGRIESLLPRMVGELPPGWRAALLVHPNAWAAHGAWQIRHWLAEFTGRGGWLVPQEGDWRTTLIAADYIVGDHGSVTMYGTLTGAPILLSGSPGQEMNPASPAAALAATAPALTAGHPLVRQLTYARDQYRREDYAAIAARITSYPGEFHRRLRRVLYGILGLGQPAYEPPTSPLPPPSPHRETA